MTEREFARIAAVLGEAVGKAMPESQATIYYDLLRDLPADAVASAARRAIAEGQYPTIPPVGVIRRLAFEATAPPAGLWPEAYGLMMRAVRAFGYYRGEAALASLPPDVRRVAEIIGWQSLCDSSPSDDGVLRAQFRDMYTTLAERDERQRRLPAALREELARLTGGLGALPAPAGEGGER